MKIVKDSNEKQIFTREEVEVSTLKYFKGDQLATTVWIDKYSLKNKVNEESGERVDYYELNPDMMHRRIAKEFARIEQKYKEPMTEEEIYQLLKGFDYIIPQGSPMAGIGNSFVNTSISNCFVVGNQPDSYGGIMMADEEQVQLMKRRGGVGQDLSHLRPSGAIAGNTPLGESCGMTLYMDRYSNSTREVQQDGRRGALMLSVSIHHPDSEKFIDKKMTPGSVTGANVSIRVSKEFMECEKNNKPFYQTFPVDKTIQELVPNFDQSINEYQFNKLYAGPIIDGQKTYFKKVDPKKIWDKLCYNAWKSAEPGILFWDRVLEESPCRFYGAEWLERSTNPCFTGDTMVAVADGRGYVSFRQLAEEGRDIDVYSESDNKVITIKTMRDIRVTAKDQKIFKITFTSGDSIRATENHKFYTTANKEVELKNLKKGQQLRSITKYKNTRGGGILNRDTKMFGDLPHFTVSSIRRDGVEDVYIGTVDMYHNFFVGNFNGRFTNESKRGSSVKSANCGEIPLPPFDSCRLLLLNLYGYVSNKFQGNAIFEDEMFIKHVHCAMRLMDDIVDLEIEKIDKILVEIELKKFDKKFQQVEKELWLKIKKKAVEGRRTGLGVTGEGDMMAALGIKYGTPEGTLFSEKLHQLLATTAYEASIDLAEERGAFPIWNPNDIESSDFLTRMFSTEQNELMTEEIQMKVAKYGRRHIAILTIAPAGTVSLMSQTSSGGEPNFFVWYFRKKKVTNEDYYDVIDEVGDKWIEYPVFHKPFIDFYAGSTGISYEQAEGILLKLKESELREIFEKSPYFGATAQDVDYVEKVRMQGAIQKWVDHSISVTVNMPESVTVEMVRDVYRQAFESGCKGITVYRDNSRGNVLSTTSDKEEVTEKFEYINSIKRPKQLECDVFFKTSRGNDFLIFVGKLDNKPYEVFAVPHLRVTTVSKKTKTGLLIKQGKGVYSFADKEGKVLIQNLGEYMYENEQNSTRMLSSLLRHRVDPGFVSETILKFATINSFHQVIAKVLQTYSNEGGEKCPECKTVMIMTEGCKKCPSCGNSACN
jgi:ribonucleotide reductase alpha subunit